MTKALKYVLITVSGLVTLFVVALAVIALTVDPNKFKPQIVQIVQEKKQRTLTLEGDIKLKLFPKLGVDLGKTRLSEHKGSGEFAAVDSVRLYVAWMPLLRKELVVDRITVEGARANLLRRADGSTNFDDLMSKDENEQESKQVKFDIDGVSIRNTALSFDDRMAKRKLSIHDFALETGHISDNTHTKIEMAFKLDADQPKVAAKISLKSGLLFALEEKRFALDGLDLKVNGEAAGISGLDMLLRGNLAAKGSGEVAMEELHFSLKGQRAQDKLDIALDAPKLLLTQDKAEAKQLALKAKVEQAQGAMSVTLAFPSLTGNIQRFQIDQLSLGLDVANPKLPKGGVKLQFAGSANVDMPKEKAGLNLKTKFDDSTIQAKLAVNKFDPMHFDVDLDIDQIDVDRYLPPKTAGGTDKGKPAAQAPESPIDLSGLNALNASGSLKIGKLKVSNVKANNVRMEMQAGGGRVEINPMTANLYQGGVKGSVSATTVLGPHIAVQQSLTGISIGPLLKDLADKDVLEGRGNVALNVTTQGKTISAMKKALNGTASVNLADGAIKGINIAGMLRTAKAKLSGETQTQSANAQEQTDFSELKASFNIRNGVAHNDDLSAKSPLLRLAGNGDIDIGNSAMDYVAKATVVGSLEGQGGKELSQLKGVTVPVRMTGPFDALKFSLDTKSLVTESAKAKIEEKKQEIREKAKDQLLKGLFGR